ncbi:Holliday junction branch migration protein RuvA [Endozoicomonas sp. GU-1]|uniref:Holliday junction branch migration protein RuvA n=1 Tax=Endozoicomonas sp. GU-1 TaxID=3009078 RepID=UPI0022B3651C|nr:Holliday junction branch migration protein RuvA [Endozoicomonas sp. GU-1]WBA80157.1 Holliday junction branch migration protein RuvA [Endozoicomonas sp. GU-1]WBA87732.1 Holliday junction branch migration protein RuvA [Endozoicomonas sp. GU-1]
MIGRLRGILLEKKAPYLLIEAGGVGYEVEAPMSVFYRLPEVGVEATLYTHFVVREDAQLLYGFSDARERELFRTLIKVNGVGPKLGLTLLSGIEASVFVRCVHDGDSSTLVKLPGVGKKTAERLIVELKDKLSTWDSSAAQFDGLTGTPLGQALAKQAADTEQEAVSALVALGYKPQEASKVIGRIKVEGLSSEELIRQALRSMI